MKTLEKSDIYKAKRKAKNLMMNYPQPKNRNPTKNLIPLREKGHESKVHTF